MSSSQSPARGGERVIVNSVFLSLTLSDALQLSEQMEFLNTGLTRTMVGYGSGARLVFHVPTALARACTIYY